VLGSLAAIDYRGCVTVEFFYRSWLPGGRRLLDLQMSIVS
jgi:hypothetical protein